MKVWINAALALLGAVLLSALLAVYFVLRALQPAPGEWTRRVALGPWSREISMPAALRIASHPFVLRLLEGRRFATPYGTVQWQAVAAPNTWRAVCAPCTLRIDGIGRETLRVSRVELTVVPDAEMNLQGSFALGATGQAVVGRWSSRIEPGGVVVKFRLVDEPMARVYALFADQIAELARADIQGRLSLDAQWRLPERAWTLKPRVEGLRVSGLGTEALLHAQPACGELGDPGPWLPRAVIAAEDQRYYEHSGYDLNEVVAAWQANGRAGQARVGASTLSQQLAKLLYTGDSRSTARKLRELLYAVELDRTLGKARVLHLYLAMAPWGHGQCGAGSAARHYFGKPVAALTPVEAVWLATLLHNPDRELARLGRHGTVNVERLAWVAGQLRPLSRGERAALVREVGRYRPPPELLTSALQVAASEAARGR